MKETEHESFELTKASFGSIEALIADARGNATLLPDRVRIGFAAQYLRLAAQKSVALAELVDAVSKTDKRQGDRAKKRIRQVDRAIEKFCDQVSNDSQRMLAKHGGKVVQLSGDQARELIEAVVSKRDIPPHLLDVEATDDSPEVDADDSVALVESSDGPTAASEPTKAREDIREDTMVAVEVGAYQAWTEFSDLAYKKGGLLGVVQWVIEAITKYDESANVAAEEAPHCENLQRATVARFMWEEFLPDACDALRELPDGPFYWELADGGTTGFPKPGEVLRTAAESRKVRDTLLEKFEVYRATKGNVLPGFWDEIRTAAGVQAA